MLTEADWGGGGGGGAFVVLRYFRVPAVLGRPECTCSDVRPIGGNADASTGHEFSNHHVPATISRVPYPYGMARTQDTRGGLAGGCLTGSVARRKGWSHLKTGRISDLP